MPIDILSMVGVAGAWIAGLAIIFATAAYCFGILRPALFKIANIWMLVFNIGLVIMFGALLAIQISRNDPNPAPLWIFSALGLVVSIVLTGVFFAVTRGVLTANTAATILETARRRIEF